MSRTSWQWREEPVDRQQAHFEVRYGSAIEAGWDEWLPVALIGPPVDAVFPVELIVDPAAPESAAATRETLADLAFYLVDKRESDPWRYARHHCETSANLYGSVHWRYTNADARPSSPRGRDRRHDNGSKPPPDARRPRQER